MIVDPKAELEALAYQIFSWNRTVVNYTYADALVCADAAITQMLTEVPATEVLAHPLIKWTADTFGIGWYAASAAVGPCLPGGGGGGSEWDGLIAAWELDGDDSASRVDASGNGYNFVNVATQPTQVAGVIGEARNSASNNSDYSTDGDLIFANATGVPFTMMCWKNTTEVSLERSSSFLKKKRPNVGNGSMVRFYTRDGFNRFWWNKPGNSSGQLSIAGMNAGVWEFVCGRYDGSAMYFSVNGGSVVSDVAPNLTNEPAATHSATVFKSSAEPGWCSVDLARYFDRCLTDDEVLTHYNGGAGLPYPT